MNFNITILTPCQLAVKSPCSARPATNAAKGLSSVKRNEIHPDKEIPAGVV